MPSGECVVLTLCGCREASKSTPLTQGMERMLTPSEYLVDIGLVSHVPYDAILWGIKDIVHRYRDLYGSKVCPKVTRIYRERLQHETSYLSTQLW